MEQTLYLLPAGLLFKKWSLTAYFLLLWTLFPVSADERKCSADLTLVWPFVSP